MFFCYFAYCLLVLSLVLRLGIFGKELYKAEALARIIFLVSTVMGVVAIRSSSFFLFSSIFFVNSSLDILPSAFSLFSFYSAN